MPLQHKSQIKVLPKGHFKKTSYISVCLIKKFIMYKLKYLLKLININKKVSEGQTLKIPVKKTNASK